MRKINFINIGKGVSNVTLPSKNLFRPNMSDKVARVGLPGLSERNAEFVGDKSEIVDIFLLKYFSQFSHLSTSFSE